ncbi:hypothetical protein D3C85_1406420 [compost metagenome]
MAAEASFNTDTLSTSFGFRRSKPPALFGTPSITIKASLFPNELTPRIRIEEPSYPGSPLDCMAVTPGILPAREFDRLAVGVLARSAPFTEVTAPETTAFFCVPYPTTTISDKSWLFSSSFTLIRLWLFTAIS